MILTFPLLLTLLLLLLSSSSSSYYNYNYYYKKDHCSPDKSSNSNNYCTILPFTLNYLWLKIWLIYFYSSQSPCVIPFNLSSKPLLYLVFIILFYFYFGFFWLIYLFNFLKLIYESVDYFETSKLITK